MSQNKAELCPRLEQLVVSVLAELGIDATEQKAMADEPHLTTAKLTQAFDHLKRHVVLREVNFVGPPRRRREEWRPFAKNAAEEGLR